MELQDFKNVMDKHFAQYKAKAKYKTFGAYMYHTTGVRLTKGRGFDSLAESDDQVTFDMFLSLFDVDSCFNQD